MAVAARAVNDLAAITSWQGLATLAITIGFSSMRLAVAFLIVPIFSNESIPALIRNSIFAALALVIATVQPIDPQLLGASVVRLLVIVAKEIFLGVSLGVLFGAFLWAFEAAGELLDTQIGTAQAQIFDPISGHEVTLFSEFLGRFVNFLFMAVGGLSLLTGVVLKSFAVWPIDAALPPLERDGASLLVDSLADVFTLSLLVAAPVLVVLFMVDFAMGLINRFAQRLNVYFLSNSIKYLIAIVLVLMLMAGLIDRLVATLDDNAAAAIELVRELFER